MKKVLALLTIVLCTMTAAMAQGGPQQTPEERKAATIERLKPLNLSAVQQDSAVAILLDRSAMGNMRDMTPEQRQEATKTYTESRNKRLEKALGVDLAKKVIETIPVRGPRPSGGK